SSSRPVAVPRWAAVLGSRVADDGRRQLADLERNGRHTYRARHLGRLWRVAQRVAVLLERSVLNVVRVDLQLRLAEEAGDLLAPGFRRLVLALLEDLHSSSFLE